jgi:hypothetical protein
VSPFEPTPFAEAATAELEAPAPRRAPLAASLPALPRPSRSTQILGGILVIAAALRLFGLNWDAGHHLHPDERFITTVASAIHWPTLTQYFDARSPLNPNAIPSVSYVYGTFSLFVVRATAELVQLAATAALPTGEPTDVATRLRTLTSYDQVYLLGRLFSVLSDLLTIWLIYLIGRRLYGTSVGLLGALFAALAVHMIQTAHFFTVEAPLTLLTTLAFYFAIRAAQSGTMADWSFFGLSTGLAAACKVSAFMLLPIGVVAAGVLWYRATQVGAYEERRRLLYEDLVTGLFAFGALAFVAFRVAQPYAFAGPGLFDIGPNARFMEVFTNFQRIGTGENDVPFNDSWAGATPYLWQLTNMGLWGLGIPLTIVAWLGFTLACWQLIRDPRRYHMHAIGVAWVGLNFLYWGIQFTKLMRYLLPIYPQLTLFAALLVVSVWRWAQAAREREWSVQGSVDRQRHAAEALEAERLGRFVSGPSVRGWAFAAPRLVPADAAPAPDDGLRRRLPARTRRERRFPIAESTLARAFVILVVAWTAFYALAFTSIYARPITRIEASQWIYDNIPPGTRIGSEHWDDRLPLGVPGRDPGLYPSVELALYNEDTPEKRTQLFSRLDEAQYIVLSSNRLCGSIPKIPRRYPMATRYYQTLFSGELGFEQIAVFTSRPSLLGIELNDDDAEESFTVYDHPKVTILRKSAGYSSENTRRILESVDLSEVLRGQKPANASSTGLLLAPSERAAVRESGTWSDIFDRESPVNAVPLLVWLLVVQLIGLAAVPLTWWMCRRLGDAGYPLAKTLGLIVVGCSPVSTSCLSVGPRSSWRSCCLARHLPSWSRDLVVSSGKILPRVGCRSSPPRRSSWSPSRASRFCASSTRTSGTRHTAARSRWTSPISTPSSSLITSRRTIRGSRAGTSTTTTSGR